MENGIHLTILTPTQKLVDVKGVSEIYFRTSAGSMGIMPGYAPTITDLDIGVVIYTHANTSGILRISGGLARIEENNKVTLFADVAEEASHIDLARAQKALERAEMLLVSELSDADRKNTTAAKLRALARIEAVELYSQNKSKS